MSTDNIIVAIKVRPLIEREKKAKLSVHWNVQGRAIIQLDYNGQPYGEPYCFDHVFDENCTTKDVYSDVVKNYIKSAMEGFNLTIFAYGQTSSGKTYTMMGNENSPGIIQLAVNDIFQYINENPERQFLISCSYFEIYNEQIFDLLAVDQKTLKVREDLSGNISIQTIETVTTTPEAVLKVMNTGNKARKMGSTKMNQRSSRSHTIFKISITSSMDKDDVKSSHVYLVDLAGSERVSQTKAEGERLKEGVNINKSLSALGNVIRQLSEQDSFVSYRDSKLTRILQPALGGNSKSLLITTITIAAGEETKSSLEFSQRAKIVKNKPVINLVKSTEDARIQEVCEQYQKRMAILQEKAKKFELERDKALSELMFLKDDLNTVMEFQQRVYNVESSERKIRRHTLGSYNPSREVSSLVGMPFTTPGHSKRPVFRESTTSTTEPEETFSLEKNKKEDTNVVAVCTPGAKSSVRTLTTIDEETAPEMLELSADNSAVDLGQTPSKIWKERHKELEKSFESLREYTNFEKLFTDEEGGFVRSVLEAKDKLYSDLISIQALLMDERKKHSAETYEQQNALELLKENNEKLSRELQQLEVAKATAEYKYDQLKDSAEVQARNMDNILKEKEKTFDNKICYYRDRINECNQENAKLTRSLEELQSEKYESELQLKELHENVSKNNPQTDQELLSKLYELQDILMDDFNKQFQGVMTQTEDINEPSEIKTIKEKLEEFEKQNEQLEQDNAELKQSYLVVQSDKDQIQNELDKMLIEKDNFKSMFDEIKAQNNDLKIQLEGAETEYLTTDHYQSLIYEWKQCINNFRTVCTELNQSEEIKQMLIHVKKDKFEIITRLEDTVALSEQSLQAISAKFPKSSEPLRTDQIETLTKENENLRSEIAKLLDVDKVLTQEKHDLSELVEVFSDIEKQLLEKVEKLEGELNGIKQQNTILLEKKSDLNQKLKQKVEEINKLSEKIENFEERIKNDRENVIKNEEYFKNEFNKIVTENEKLTKENDYLNAQVKIFSDKEKQLVEKVDNLDRGLTDIKQQNTILLEKNSALNKKLKEKVEEINKLSEKIENFEERVKNDRENLIKNEEGFKNEFSKIVTENEKLTKENDYLNAQVKIYSDKEKHLVVKVENHERGLNDIKQQNTILLEKNSDLNQKLKEKVEEVNKLFEKIENFEERVKNNRENLIKNEECFKNEFNKKVTENEKLTKENVYLNAQVKIFSDKEKQLQETIHSLQRELSVINDLKQQNFILQEINSELKLEINGKVEEINKMSEDIQNLKEFVQDIGDEKDTIEQNKIIANLQLNNKLEEISKLHKEKNDLSAQIATFFVKEENLQDQIKILQKELCCRIEIKEHDKIVQDIRLKMKQEIEEKLSGIDQMTKDLQKRDKEMTELNKSFEANITKLKEATALNEVLTEDRNRLILEAENMRKEIQNLNEGLKNHSKEFEKKVKLLKIEVATKAEHIKTLSKQKDDLSSQIKFISGQLKKTENEKFKYSFEIEQLQITEKQLREKIEKINKELSITTTLKDENESLIQTSSKLEQEIKQKTKEIDTLKENLKKQATRISNLEETSKGSTEKFEFFVKKKTAEIVPLKHELSEKTEKIMKLEYEIEKKSQIIRELEGDIVQKRKQLDEYSCCVDEIKRLKDEINLLSGQVRKNESELKENKETIQHLEEQIREKNKKIRCLELENIEQLEQIKKLKENTAKINYQRQMSEQREQMEIIDRKKVEKIPETRLRQEKEQDRKKKVYTLYDSRRSLSSSDDVDDLQLLRTDFEKLQEDYHKKQQIVTRMQTELDRIQKTNDHLVCNNTKLKEEKDHFKSQYCMLSLEVNHYKTELEKVRSKLSDVPADVGSELQKKFEKATEDCAELKKLLKQKVNELKESQKLIASLEEIKQKKYIEYVDLQTKMYDIMNNQEAQKAIYQNKILALENRISQLKSKKGEDIILQTDLTMVELDKKDEKYQMTKRVANMRREENLKLRRRLGLPPDTALN